ncbi:MAG: hypothetical protein VR64_02300 [Desulfatitalea sp. BRH_c12]|nr:MAG: hypothetical protein VR64_02300 [Desulfatitalea sp. BRH_c12]
MYNGNAIHKNLQWVGIRVHWQGNRIFVWAALQKWDIILSQRQTFVRGARHLDSHEAYGHLRAVGATGGRQREPFAFGSSHRLARKYPPARMIAVDGGFAPAPGDRRSPLQVEPLR